MKVQTFLIENDCVVKRRGRSLKEISQKQKGPNECAKEGKRTERGRSL